MMDVTLSPSNMMQFRQCPLRFYGQSVSKEIKYRTTAQKDRGTAVHETVERHVHARTLPDLVDTKVDMDYLRRRMSELFGMEGDLWTEHEMCIRKDGTQCGFWDEDCFIRSRADIVLRPTDLTKPMLIVDLKTGKKWDREDFQLKVYAMLAHAIYRPDVVRYAYWYLDSGETVEGEIRFPEDRMKLLEVLQTVLDMEKASEARRYPPRKNRFCRFCEWRGTDRCRA